jgi:amino acid transporter
MTQAPPSSDAPGYIKSLGLWDIIAINIVAVVGVRWIARGARIGAPSVTLWALAWIAFFVPLTLAVRELASRYPDQGGAYAWTRRAFGPAHGFICGWCLWVNNLFYFPSLLLFAAANALLPFGEQYASLADSRTYSTVFVLTALWLAIGLNVIGLAAGKWLQNLGTLGIWAPSALLIGAGIVALAVFGSATSFAPPELLPRGDLLTSLSLWSAMCFAFSGFEITSYIGQEVKNPTRNIPLGVTIAGLVVTLIYIGGSASVLVAVPSSALAERSGIADAVDLVSERVGLPGVGALTGLLVALGALAAANSWIGGSARVPFAAGMDNLLPRTFARLHPRFRTPHVALVVQGAVSSLIFVVSVFLSVTGGRTTVQDAYDIMVNLTILVYFVPYVYIFLSLGRLRRVSSDFDRQPLTRAMRVPGGVAGMTLVTTLGLLATTISLGLLFVPPPGTTAVLNYELNLILQTLAVIAVGWIMYRRRGAGHKAPGASRHQP